MSRNQEEGRGYTKKRSRTSSRTHPSMPEGDAPDRHSGDVLAEQKMHMVECADVESIASGLSWNTTIKALSPRREGPGGKAAAASCVAPKAPEEGAAAAMAVAAGDEMGYLQAEGTSALLGSVEQGARCELLSAGRLSGHVSAVFELKMASIQGQLTYLRGEEQKIERAGWKANKMEKGAVVEKLATLRRRMQQLSKALEVCLPLPFSWK